MNTIELFSSMCRICLQDGSSTYSIFDEFTTEASIQSQLNKCFMEKIEDVEGYPTSICTSCKVTLETLCEFIDKYVESSAILKEALVKVKTEVDDSFIENYDNFMWDDQEYIVIKVEDNTENEKKCNTSEIIEKLKPLPDLKLTKVETKKCLKRKTSTTMRNAKNTKIASTKMKDKTECNGEIGEEWGLTQKSKLEENPPETSLKPNILKNMTNFNKIQENPTIQKTEYKPLVYDYCNAVFNKKYGLNNHIVEMHHSKSTTCIVCSKTYTTKKSLKDHINRYHAEKKIKCEQCCKMFTQRYLLNKHLKAVHEKKITEKPKVVKKEKPSKPETVNNFVICDYCRAFFDNKDKLQDHIEGRHIMNAPIYCTVCLKAYATEGQLNRHTKRIHGEKKFQCEECLKMFAAKGVLNSHKKRHKNNFKRTRKVYSCKLCDKTYTTALCVTLHERSVHTGFRPAVCDVCGKAFAHEIYLKEHMRLHTGELPYKCPFCDRGCTQRGNLKSHLRQHKVSEVTDTIKSQMRPSYWKYLKNC